MLDVRSLTAGYRKKTVLHDLSVSFAAGKLTSVIGPNGCGKSTLLKAVLGLIPRAAGEIDLDGEVLSSLGRRKIAKRLAYLAQGQPIPDMTVEQMVLHGRFPYLEYPHGYTDRDRAHARAAMERVGIPHLADSPMAALSGGMRQTAYVAMALAQDTAYLLLDEPTTYLDVAHQVALMKLLRSITTEGRGVVAVMHDLPLALTYSDCIVLMDAGRVVAFGAPDEIARSGGIEAVLGVSVDRAEGEYFCRLGM